MSKIQNLIFLISTISTAVLATTVEWTNYPKPNNNVVWQMGDQISPIFCWKDTKKARRDTENWSLYIDHPFKRKVQIDKVEFIPAGKYLKVAKAEGILANVFSDEIKSTTKLLAVDEDGNPFCYVAVGTLPAKIKGTFYLKLKRKWEWKWVPGHRDYAGSDYFKIFPQLQEKKATNDWTQKDVSVCNEAYGKCKQVFSSAKQTCKVSYEKCMNKTKRSCSSLKESCKSFRQKCKDFWGKCTRKSKDVSEGANSDAQKQHESEEDRLATRAQAAELERKKFPGEQ